MKKHLSHDFDPEQDFASSCAVNKLCGLSSAAIGRSEHSPQYETSLKRRGPPCRKKRTQVFLGKPNHDERIHTETEVED